MNDMTSRFLWLTMLFGLAWCGTSCKTTSTQPPSQAIVPDKPPGATAPQGYRIQLFDTLHITVFQEADLTVKARVATLGTINYPLLGTIAVAGKTAADVEQQITRDLGKKYVVNPQVTVQVEGSANRRVAVLGQVKNPGTFDLPTDEPLRLMQALARAGGFTGIAATDRVVILRSVNGVEQKMVVNVAAIIRSGDNVQNIVLEPGDVVTVPETIF